MPLVLDAFASFAARSFAASDVQEALAQMHDVAMPQHTVVTLLNRAVAKKQLLREAGRYKRNLAEELPPSSVVERKAQIEVDQRQLGEALRKHAAQRGLPLPSAEAALEILLRFLEDEQVGMLLDGIPRLPDTGEGVARERSIVAEFLSDFVKHDAALMAALRGMLEGLVLYHAAFLPDLSTATRRFKDLSVVFDSNVVRQTLGYEGAAMRALMKETLDVLKANGVQCLVLDKTIHEIQRILAMYEVRLATADGRSSLRQVPMARHFLTQRYSPSDIREMSALLDREVLAAGFQVMPAPRRVREYTSGERTLAARLADPSTKDELEPRVVHDVDCVAAILTLRRGRRSASLDDARAVFATSSPLVIRNTRLWWEEDEHEGGVPPIVHIRALANLAWLKRPSLSPDLKVRELVALCTAALRPSQIIWNRFLRHLDSLQKSQRVSSDEVAAILVSAMSDRLLKDVEIEQSDPSDIDAVSLDEVVDRVRASYATQAEERIRAISDEYNRKLADLQASEDQAVRRANELQRTTAEAARRRDVLLDGRAQRLARLVAGSVEGAMVLVACGGAVALVVGHPFHAGWPGIVVGVAVVCFVALELGGILRHVRGLRASTETALRRRFRIWLEGEDVGPAAQ